MNIQFNKELEMLCFFTRTYFESREKWFELFPILVRVPSAFWPISLLGGILSLLSFFVEAIADETESSRISIYFGFYESLAKIELLLFSVFFALLFLFSFALHIIASAARIGVAKEAEKISEQLKKIDKIEEGVFSLHSFRESIEEIRAIERVWRMLAPSFKERLLELSHADACHRVFGRPESAKKVSRFRLWTANLSKNIDYKELVEKYFKN